ncbi:MAG TPA: inorganic diphosphatase [Candidatus Acidoferrales bacterium]|nr:inorganic diphosphatase [Candidatus Acidoferrales bacterium]
MIVEIPKGSSNKYEYDADLQLFRVDRPLYVPLNYPGEYGFIPGTLSEDGDPLDILSLVSEPSYPGIVLLARPLGVLDLIDRGQRDQKVLAAADKDPRFDEVRSVDQVWSHSLREIEEFFAIYKKLEGEEVNVKGWRGLAAARSLITCCRERYLKAHPA